jgi:methionine-gamma-lyase
VETPANPTNDLFDMELAARVAARHGAVTVVDNTFLSPVWQKPIRHGADLVLHSATKYLGGHSDLTAGVVCGRADLIDRLRHTRYEIGTTAQPSTAWLLSRSVETLQIRVERQTATATRVAAFLADHPKVRMVSHLSLLGPDDPQYELYKRQCLGPGAMISFDVEGGEEGAFRLLNAMEVVRLAVSLGGTESLASHPWTMSHSLVPPEEKLDIGVTPGLIRLSIGVEGADDLIADLGRALDRV